MHRKLILFISFTFLLIYNSSGQTSRRVFSLSGIVVDTLNVPKDKASVFLMPGNHHLMSDSSGRFSINLTEGFYQLRVSYLSSNEYIQTIRLHKNTDLNVVLNSQETNLDELEVKTKTLVDVQSTALGKTLIDVKVLKKIPSFLGEPDVIKSISTLPGVINAGEGASGFYVRGGGADQNLVLFDDAPVFNTAHLFGFFSVFNSEILKGYSFLRSGISAKYGGRISSILEVNTRDGNHNKVNYSFGISPIALKFAMDGPINSKMTFLLAGRFANPNYVLRLFPSDDIKKSRASFYDLNGKLNYKINQKNNITLSAYRSQDDFKFPFDTTYHYTNTLGTLKWSRSFGRNLFGNASLIYSQYQNAVKGIDPKEQFVLNSSIENKQIKIDFLKTHKNGSNLEFGAGMGLFLINPGGLNVQNSESKYNSIYLNKDKGREFWSYVNKDFILNSKIAISVGLRHNIFQKLGADDVLIFDPNLPHSINSVIDIKSYGENQVIKTYSGFEPRFSMKYALNENASIKMGINRSRQNIQLISNTSALTPADVWRLDNNTIKPQISDQISIGYFSLSESKNYEFSWEIYYKKMQNQIDYKDGAVLILNKYLEADLLEGIGKAYGSEFFIRKNEGAITGWWSFSYSRSLRKIAGATVSETINEGNWYASNYDKPINTNLFLNYQFPYSPWSFSTNTVYTSGRPVTASDSYFQYGNNTIFTNYLGRNQERMPATFRLDIAFLRHSPPEKKIQTEWGISVYNLTFRKNAFSTLFKHYYGLPPSAYKLSIIGIAIPSLNFNIKF